MAANTILDGMNAIGLSAIVQPALGNSPAMRVATEIFSNSFETCMDLTDEQIDSAMKAFSNLTIAQGKVVIMPGAITRMKAYTQFVCHHIRIGVNPSTIAFNVAEATNYVRQRATQKIFEKDSSDLASNAKPSNFKTTDKWIIWCKGLYNYLRLIPGRNGVPLSYIVRANDNPDLTPQPDFLDLYVRAAPLNGTAYAADNTKVFIILKKLTEDHAEAALIVARFEDTSDGRAATKALENKYEGHGIHALSRKQAVDDIEKMFYSGEKPPTMTWDIFETRIKAAYVSIERLDGAGAYHPRYRLQKLMENVTAEFLDPVKESINVAIQQAAVTGIDYTWDMALDAFQNKVNRKYPNRSNSNNHHTRRNIRETSTSDRKRKQPSTVGAKGKNQIKKGRRDSEIVKLKNGNWIDYHPSYRFSAKVFSEFPDSLRDKLHRQRKEYKERNNGGGGNRSEASTHRQIEEMSQRIVEINRQLAQAQQKVPTSVLVDNDSTIASDRDRNDNSGGSARRSIMGGRNEQAQQRRDRNRRSPS